MNTSDHSLDAALRRQLADYAAPVDDDGFSDAVMERVDRSRVGLRVRAALLLGGLAPVGAGLALWAAPLVAESVASVPPLWWAAVVLPMLGVWVLLDAEA